jgi:hypothetical protein
LQILPGMATIREAQKFMGKHFAPTRLICGVVSKRGSGEKCLFEAGDGTADEFVQGAGRVLGIGAENAPRGRSGKWWLQEQKKLPRPQADIEDCEVNSSSL